MEVGLMPIVSYDTNIKITLKMIFFSIFFVLRYYLHVVFMNKHRPQFCWWALQGIIAFIGTKNGIFHVVQSCTTCCTIMLYKQFTLHKKKKEKKRKVIKV